MATVPLGEFANPGSPAQPVPFDPGSAPQNTGAAAVGEALQQAGQHEFNQQLQIMSDTANAKAAAQLTAYDTQAKSDALEIAQQVQDGALDPSTAADTYKELRKSRDQPEPIPGLPKTTQIHLQAGMQNADLESSLTVQRIANKAQRDQGKAAAVSTFDNIVQGASLPGADLDKATAQIDNATQLARSNGVPDYLATKLSINAKQSIYENDAKNRVMQAGDNIDQLSAIRTDLNDPKGKYATTLEPDKRIAIASHVDNQIDIAQRRIDHATAAREAGATKTLNQLDAMTADGVMPNLQTTDAMTKAVAGTSQEQEFRDRINENKEASQFVLKTPAEQEAYIAERAQDMEKNGVRSAREVPQLAKLVGLAQKDAALRESSPMDWTMKRGIDPEVQPINWQAAMTPVGADATGNQLVSRSLSLGATQAKYGNVSDKLLTASEADSLTQVLAKANPGQKLAVYGQLNTLSKGDPKIYDSLMRQIAPNAPVEARAGQIYAMGNVNSASFGGGMFSSGQTRSAQAVAATMLNGAAALGQTNKTADGKVPSVDMPKESEFSAAFNSQIGDAYPSAAARDRKLQEVRAYYAGRSAELGTSSDTVQPGLMKEAIVATQGQPLLLNDHHVVAPWGMAEQEFRDRAVPAIAAATSYRKDNGQTAAAAHLEPVVGNDGSPIDGLYHVALGRGPLFDVKGNAVLVKISGSDPMPVAPKAKPEQAKPNDNPFAD